MRAAGALEDQPSHPTCAPRPFCSESLTEELAQFGPGDRIGILSLMDHTPEGNGNSADIGQYGDLHRRGKARLCRKRSIQEHVRTRQALGDAVARHPLRPPPVERPRSGWAPCWASHDDTLDRACRCASPRIGHRAGRVPDHRRGRARLSPAWGSAVMRGRAEPRAGRVAIRAMSRPWTSRGGGCWISCRP